MPMPAFTESSSNGATARILADPELAARLTRQLPGGDHGEVTAP
ncbi:hypothetical protein [Streptomyces glaucus]|uniref:Uncharacterized protein n=1 Tax=Streptomyces glaucus TaxID=284029 RepID=A0ABN3JQQ2_9ACTN